MESNNNFCENNCGRPVDREGGTCQACWQVIDEAKGGTVRIGQNVSLKGVGTFTRK